MVNHFTVICQMEPVLNLNDNAEIWLLIRLHRIHEVWAIVSDDTNVCQSVCHAGRLCKNGSMDQCPLWGGHYREPEKHCVIWAPNLPTTRGSGLDALLFQINYFSHLSFFTAVIILQTWSRTLNVLTLMSLTSSSLSKSLSAISVFSISSKLCSSLSGKQLKTLDRAVFTRSCMSSSDNLGSKLLTKLASRNHNITN